MSTTTIPEAAPSQQPAWTPFLDAMLSRRTHHQTSSTLPSTTPSQVRDLVRHVLLHTPSTFNTQTTRAVVLFGPDSRRLWADLAPAAVLDKMPEAMRAHTASNFAKFADAAGTVLFYVDPESLGPLKDKFAAYGPAFDGWALQSAGMSEFAVWTALATQGIGASLQHYGPLVDSEVAKAWGIPEGWKGDAQLVFGGKAVEPAEKTFLPIEDRYKEFGI